MAHRWKLVLVGAVVAPGLVACGGTTDGNPTASGTPEPVRLFDPCTEISDDSLRAVGVDPTTEESGVAGIHQSGWEICSWDGKTYSLTVYSTGRKVTEFESKPGNVDFHDVTIAGRTGRQFRVRGASYDLNCDMIFPAEQGVIQIAVMSNPILKNPPPPCAELLEAGEVLVPTLPK